MQLTKEIILDAALEILDEYGLQDLTIRRLARHLDVAAGAMYWHYPSKQALLGAVADRILTPLTTREFTGGWRDNVSKFITAFHECLTHHRDGAEIVAAAMATGTAQLSPLSLLAPLLDDAPSNFSATDLASTLVHFTIGTTLDEQTTERMAELAKDDPSLSVDEIRQQGLRRITLGCEIILAGIEAAG